MNPRIYIYDGVLAISIWQDGTVTLARRASEGDVWGPPVKLEEAS